MNQPTFTLFDQPHVVVLLTTICLLAAGLCFLNKRITPPDFRKNHRLLGVLLVANLVFWRLLFLLRADFHIGWDLPIHVCGMSQIFLAIYLWTEQQILYDIAFHWVITGSTLGVLIPDLDIGFPSVRFFALFVSHGFSLFVVLLLFFVQRHTPRPKSYHISIWVLTLYACVFILPLDYLLKANYLYMFEPPNINFPLLRFLPPWPWYWPVLFAFFYLLFREIYVGSRQSLLRIIKREQERFQTGAG
ncbi:MAG TPA: TIGR02206 family membrane protein [bacterium]|nr:TIGR02206 family membrane protein [bacterium]